MIARHFTNQAAASLLPKDDPSTARRQAWRDRWLRKDHHPKQLPPPEELERVQLRLINAARKGKAEFNRVWAEIFHGRFPSPGVTKYLPNKEVLRTSRAG